MSHFPRWGEVSRHGDYRKPNKTTTLQMFYLASLCKHLPNIARTCKTFWHKTDTEYGILEPPGRHKKAAETQGRVHGGQSRYRAGICNCDAITRRHRRAIPSLAVHQ